MCIHIYIYIYIHICTQTFGYTVMGLLVIGLQTSVYIYIYNQHQMGIFMGFTVTTEKPDISRRFFVVDLSPSLLWLRFWRRKKMVSSSLKKI